MSKKISMSRKRFQKAREEAWLTGHQHGLTSGYRDGEAYGRDAMNAEVAGEVIAPVLDAAIGLIESNLEGYAHVLLVALRDKAREIGGEELDDVADAGDDEHECAGCCEDCQPIGEADASYSISDALNEVLSQLARGNAGPQHIEPVQDGCEPL